MNQIISCFSNTKNVNIDCILHRTSDLPLCQLAQVSPTLLMCSSKFTLSGCSLGKQHAYRFCMSACIFCFNFFWARKSYRLENFQVCVCTCARFFFFFQCKRVFYLCSIVEFFKEFVYCCAFGLSDTHRVALKFPNKMTGWLLTGMIRGSSRRNRLFFIFVSKAWLVLVDV